MTVLLTGGAGYIGSHVVRQLQRTGEHVIVVDDLSTGVAARIAGVESLRLDLTAAGAEQALRGLLRAHGVDAVVHLAGKKRVDESVRRPTHYFQQNVGGLAALLAAVEGEGVPHLVFSSSAAVYGSVDGDAVEESAPLRPQNPYGRSKLAGEWMVEAATAAGAVVGCSLRYFNVAGAGGPDLIDEAGTNLIPATVTRMRRGETPLVFGTDWATPDGTCVRDYVHVVDLATAHVAALQGLRAGAAGPAYNVGTGAGHSVRQVVEEIARQLDLPADLVDAGRRDGDPQQVVADVSRIAADLGWHASLGLPEMVASSLPAALPVHA